MDICFSVLSLRTVGIMSVFYFYTKLDFTIELEDECQKETTKKIRSHTESPCDRSRKRIDGKKGIKACELNYSENDN